MASVTPPSSFADELLSRIEDASLNASAPAQQRWLDGWLLRFSPGKAKRARCINAVAEGRLPLDRKLALALPVFAEAGLPMLFRITRFSQPAGLDAALAERGFESLDDTRVMVNLRLSRSAPPRLAAGLRLLEMAPQAFAQAVGALRGSPQPQRDAHAQRLAHSPVRYQRYAFVRDGDAAVLACGQFAREAELVGLYDVFTAPTERGKGLAQQLCEHMLSISTNEGAEIGYLQVESDNLVARSIYTRLGFADAYDYHYRQAP